MKLNLLITSFLISSLCISQEKISLKKFNDIVLLNRISFIDPNYDQPKFGCAFLLRHKDSTYAVTAKHILQFIKTPSMNNLALDGAVKEWSFFTMDKPENRVIARKLLNVNNSQLLSDKTIYKNDWLVFSLASNKLNVEPLQPRMTPLSEGEKLYVVGWTRKMEQGPQRIYEFTYYKTIANRILLEEVLVPEQFGGLSGAPVVDENGKVAGIVSNSTMDPISGKKYFSPCSLQELLKFLDAR